MSYSSYGIRKEEVKKCLDEETVCNCVVNTTSNVHEKQFALCTIHVISDVSFPRNRHATQSFSGLIFNYVYFDFNRFTTVLLVEERC